MTGDVAVAISTTGDVHRLPLLRQCVQAWSDVLPRGGSLFVTVDGNEDACQRVLATVDYWTGSVFRVGQRVLDPQHHPDTWYAPETGLRLGVAVNKNTGLELMMGNTSAYDLFLSDDDTWPLFTQSIQKHIDLRIAHSMVMWGKHRLYAKYTNPNTSHSQWAWPRGVVLYQTRRVVERVGGMDERFGPGGHEHVEYSQRVHNAGFTPAPFCSPASYSTCNGMGAAALWHAEDMRRPGEKLGDHRLRRRNLTSVRREPTDWDHINQIMAEREGSDAFVPYLARDNGRASATLCLINPSQGAEESK